jgi:hypothetical protein
MSHLHLQAQLLALARDNLRELVHAELLGELVEHAELSLVGGVVNCDLDAAHCREQWKDRVQPR